METTTLQRMGPQGPMTVALPVLTKPTGFIHTPEGNNLYAKYGPTSPKYLSAKARWQQEQIAQTAQGGEKKKMNELQIFESTRFGSVRTVTIDDKLYFCGSDVAKALGYGNPPDALRRHCKGIVKRDIPTSSGFQEMLFIPESDLYRLIARSKLPEAEKFESWIFEEVVPSVIHHGGYLTPAKVEEALLNPDVLIQLATNLKAEQAKRRMLEVKVAEDAPKVLFANSVAASEDSILIGNLAKLLCQSGVKTGQNRLFEQMRQDGYLCSAFGERRNTPTQRAVDMGLFEVQTHVVQNGDDTPRTRYTTKVTGKGQVYFMNKYGAAQAN